jgi:hypothetical protein
MKVKHAYKLAVIVSCFGMVFSGPLLADDAASTDEDDSADIMAMLTQELKLSPEQAKQLGAELKQFAGTLDRLKSEQDQKEEDADPDALIKGAKKAQDEYLQAIKKILTPDQLNQYNALKEKAIKGTLRDLVEIQLMDNQSKLGITDEQITKLVPIMGDSLYQAITLVWQHAGKRLRVGQKIKLAKQLKHIQKDAHDAASKVLTPEQLQAWDKHKEEQQQQQKKK